MEQHVSNNVSIISIKQFEFKYSLERNGYKLYHCVNNYKMKCRSIAKVYQHGQWIDVSSHNKWCTISTKRKNLKEEIEISSKDISSLNETISMTSEYPCSLLDNENNEEKENNVAKNEKQNEETMEEPKQKKKEEFMVPCLKNRSLFDFIKSLVR